ncbi:MAG: nitroreductase [Deltaproteobacteria bacterium]|nr:nitroreductase [Deltaproteobacteria bacterium]
MINRRNFLKTVLAGGFIIGTGSLLSACKGIIRNDLQPPGGALETTPGLDETDVTILHYASLAPSGHNSQPWFVKIIGPKKWIVGIDSQRRLPAVDPENREALLSIGAFIENLSIAAGTLGFQIQTEIVAKTSMDEEIVKISLIKAKPVKYPLERIIKRRTIRSGFQSVEIRSSDFLALSEPLKDRLFYIPRDTEHAQCIQEGAVENFKAQSYRAEAQKELSQWMHLKTSDAKKHRSGLTTESMEISGFTGWYVRAFMDKEDVMKESFIKRGIDKVAKQAVEGGGWFIITSRGEGISDLINTGRRFERMALKAREHKLAIHPMTQFLEEKEGRDAIAKNHDDSMIPQFVLRVGYLSNYPDPVSLRRPVSWFIRT